MSKQVFLDKDKNISGGVSSLFNKNFGQSILWRRKQERNKLKYKNRKVRGVFTLKNLSSWNKRISLKFTNKNKLLRRLQTLKYYLTQRRFSKFTSFFKVLKNEVNFNKFNKFKLLKLYDLKHLNKNKNMNINTFSLIHILNRSSKLFYFSNLFMLKQGFLIHVFKALRKHHVWKYFPRWVVEKFEKILISKKRKLKKVIMRKYLIQFLRQQTSSLFLNSYNVLISNFLYGNMLRIFSLAIRSDLQKYSSSKVLLSFNFIGGVYLTPNLILKHLLYKLARLHLPTEMIPRFLFKFNGFMRRIDILEKTNKVNLKNNFRNSLLNPGSKFIKKSKYIYKHVRAFSPFLKGLFFKCNGRFTRKQDVSSFTF